MEKFPEYDREIIHGLIEKELAQKSALPLKISPKLDMPPPFAYNTARHSQWTYHYSG